jgi:FkbM family methyltransferase
MNPLAYIAESLINPLIAKCFGFRVIRNFPQFDEVRNELIEKLNIEIIIDGGANRGQWTKRLRDQIIDRKVISFEPVAENFQHLAKELSNDINWTGMNYALGETEGSSTINLSNNMSMSASLKEPLNHVDVYPTVKFENAEVINVKRLDEFDFFNGPGPFFLKLDVQGYELEALKGATEILDKVALIEVETSFREMYKGEVLHTQLVSWMEERGFSVFTIAPPAIDKSGRIGYLDVLLINNSYETNL